MTIEYLNDTLSKMEIALPGSLGEQYLFSRGISLSLAKKYRVGYSSPGSWINKYRDWKYGRLIFPHTNSNGDLISLYGRTVDIDCNAPKEIRHDHLCGKKGYFNARALLSDTVFLCEGVFDCMSLIAAGYENSTAIFGISLKWDLIKANKVVFCFDLDDTGRNQYRLAALDGLLHGKEIFSMPLEIYSGCKDINEAWIKNNNQLGKLKWDK
jgi:DNA primase